MISFDPLAIHELTLVCVASIPEMKISWATAIDITKCSLICVSPALRFLKTCEQKERGKLPGYSLFSFFVVAFFGVGGGGGGWGSAVDYLLRPCLYITAYRTFFSCKALRFTYRKTTYATIVMNSPIKEKAQPI